MLKYSLIILMPSFCASVDQCGDLVLTVSASLGMSGFFLACRIILSYSERVRGGPCKRVSLYSKSWCSGIRSCLQLCLFRPFLHLSTGTIFQIHVGFSHKNNEFPISNMFLRFSLSYWCHVERVHTPVMTMQQPQRIEWWRHCGTVKENADCAEVNGNVVQFLQSLGLGTECYFL